MKRWPIVPFIVLCLFSSAGNSTYAQSRFEKGVVFGFTSSKFEKKSYISTTSIFGTAFGIYGSYSIGKIQMRLDVLSSSIGSKFKNHYAPYEVDETRLYYVEFPLTLRYRLPRSFFVGAGLSTKIQTDSKSSGENRTYHIWNEKNYQIVPLVSAGITTHFWRTMLWEIRYSYSTVRQDYFDDEYYIDNYRFKSSAIYVLISMPF